MDEKQCPQMEPPQELSFDPHVAALRALTEWHAKQRAATRKTYLDMKAVALEGALEDMLTDNISFYHTVRDRNRQLVVAAAESGMAWELVVAAITCSNVILRDRQKESLRKFTALKAAIERNFNEAMEQKEEESARDFDAVLEAMFSPIEQGSRSTGVDIIAPKTT